MIWVDAVCINQSDDTENDRQVMLMANMYSATTRVLEWLGEGNAQTAVTICIIEGLASKRTELGIFDSSLELLEIANYEEIKSSLRNISSHLNFQALNTFFKQAWFSRTLVSIACS